jgi:hypothetical protein
VGDRVGTWIAVVGGGFAAVGALAAVLLVPDPEKTQLLHWTEGVALLAVAGVLLEVGRAIEKRSGRRRSSSDDTTAASPLPPAPVSPQQVLVPSLAPLSSAVPSPVPSPPPLGPGGNGGSSPDSSAFFNTTEHAASCGSVHRHGARALALWKVAHKMLAVSTAEGAREAESQLLASLRETCRQRDDVRRRASILRLETDRLGRRRLAFHLGELPEEFPEEYPSFTEEEFRKFGVGAAWYAIEMCTPADQRTFAAWIQEYDGDVLKRRVKPIVGDGEFNSILIAPIWKQDGKRDTKREPLGVVCLDSAQSKFYGVQDQQLVVMTSEALAIGWTKWPPAKTATA